MNKIENLSELEKIATAESIDRIVTEYLMVVKGKADALDRVAKALNRKDVTIQNIRNIVDGNDISEIDDFME